jgi:hypothetical protein
LPAQTNACSTGGESALASAATNLVQLKAASGILSDLVMYEHQLAARHRSPRTLESYRLTLEQFDRFLTDAEHTRRTEGDGLTWAARASCDLLRSVSASRATISVAGTRATAALAFDAILARGFAWRADIVSLGGVAASLVVSNIGDSLRDAGLDGRL